MKNTSQNPLSPPRMSKKKVALKKLIHGANWNNQQQFNNLERSSLDSSIDDVSPNVELRDLYTQLNRMMENLIIRIADHERRLNSLSRTVHQTNVVYDHAGLAATTPRNDISLNALAFNNIPTAPVSTLHALSLKEKKSSLPQIGSQLSFNVRNTKVKTTGNNLQDQVNYLKQKYR